MKLFILIKQGEGYYHRLSFINPLNMGGSIIFSVGEGAVSDKGNFVSEKKQGFNQNQLMPVINIPQK